MRAVLAINSEALRDRCTSVRQPFRDRFSSMVRVTRTLVLCVPLAYLGGTYRGTPAVQGFSLGLGWSKCK